MAAAAAAETADLVVVDEEEVQDLVAQLNAVNIDGEGAVTAEEFKQWLSLEDVPAVMEHVNMRQLEEATKMEEAARAGARMPAAPADDDDGEDDVVVVVPKEITIKAAQHALPPRRRPPCPPTRLQTRPALL